VDRTLRVFTSHAEAKRVERSEVLRMTPAERLRVGRELHEFGVATITPMLPDWIELCRLLSVHGVEYLVVGGQAVIAHGYPRCCSL
jgi:hypothetical protein